MTPPDQRLNEYLDEVRGRVEKATLPPWDINVGFDRFRSDPSCYGAYFETRDYNVLVSGMPEADRKFLIKSRTDVETLLRIAEAQSAALREIAAGECLNHFRPCPEDYVNQIDWCLVCVSRKAQSKVLEIIGEKK